jgi:hypothetical protein
VPPPLPLPLPLPAPESYGLTTPASGYAVGPLVLKGTAPLRGA